ncbi:MAG: hypothetical protein GXO70_06670 [Acidobacteria bacterium]|nr:hypothetical protein [Acidobacteriota bacterium]
MTAHGGTILLRKLTEDLKLHRKLNTWIRNSQSTTYHPADIILPITLMLHTGGKCLKDLARMAEDKTLCSLHKLRRIPHPTTIRR